MASIACLNPKAELARHAAALEMNISGAKGLQEVMKTNLGPKGTLKMLVSGSGDLKVTKDGNVLLHEMQIQHPTASLIAKACTAQNDVTGDGTTSTVLLIGELLKQAENYVSEGVHPHLVTEGFQLAHDHLLQLLAASKKTLPIDRPLLIEVARTTLRTKLDQKLADHVTGLHATPLSGFPIQLFDFIRAESFVFGHVADEGWMDGCAGELLRYRRAIGADQIAVVTDIKKKHCSHAITADVSVAETARAAELFLADGVVLSGAATGEAACPDELNEVRSKCSLPVLIGSGIEVNNVNLFKGADAFIVGSNFKKDGNWRNEIEKKRVENLVEKVRRMERKNRFCFSTEAFEKAQKDMKQLKEEPDNDTKLELYALFKQANEGDVRGDRPKMLEFVARAKFDAWEKVKGMPKADAQHKYAEIVNSLLKNAGINNTNTSADTSETEGKVYKIELNRPDKYNAITWEMYEGLISALGDASADRETSVTVMTGVGSYFCAGNDLSNFTRGVKTSDDLRAMADRGERVLERYVRAFIEHEKPLIGLVNGPAIGISVTVLPLFDLVIASDKATFHAPFSSLGQSPEGCSSYTFPLIMGMSKASELLLFDKKMSAEEALERNLVSRVIPNNSFGTETERMVNSLASLPPESLRLNKSLLRDVHRDALLAVNTRECALLKSRWLSDECQNALRKFMTRKSGGG
ncbi:hypothetical protein niasHS_014090 [Heterodera schachtii]|uniref:ACB domain-containing protein n=1 Tax=Heterodera schachtii TaxID=97005 RepID=A0ABD2IUD5_HETSC